MATKIGAEVREEKVSLEAIKEGADSIVSGNGNNNIQSHEPKVGRNDPCPCGSGKKYKKCHGA